MKTISKKAAIAAYKEQAATGGIYEVRCGVTDQRWIGSTPNISLESAVLQPSSKLASGRSLQAQWNEHGADSFSFRVLEQLEAEGDAYLDASKLRTRLADWKGQLAAETVV